VLSCGVSGTVGSTPSAAAACMARLLQPHHTHTHRTAELIAPPGACFQHPCLMPHPGLGGALRRTPRTRTSWRRSAWVWRSGSRMCRPLPAATRQARTNE
jgi:hypothetical protein